MGKWCRSGEEGEEETNGKIGNSVIHKRLGKVKIRPENGLEWAEVEGRRYWRKRKGK